MAAHLHHRGSLGLCLLLCAALLQTRLVAASAGNPQVTLDDAAAAAVLRASDPACKGGLPYEDVCCPRACGECGGHGCGSRPGGAVDCCASGVQNQHRSCDNSTAPCTMDKPSPSGGNCTLQPGVLYVGNDVAQALNTSSVAACCAACGANQACAFFSYDMAGTGCYMKNQDAPDTSRPDAKFVSGFVGISPPAPKPPSNVEVFIDTATLLSQTDASYICWNIDSSTNRQFFTRDLHDPKLLYLTKGLGGGYLRFGGTGNDHLTYQFGNTSCSDSSDQCLNSSMWDALYSLSSNANMKLVFGLNVLKRAAASEGEQKAAWDPTNARELIQYSIKHGYKFFGFELGNEENEVFSGNETALLNFAVLDSLLKEMYPDASARPVMVGPDPHSFKQNGPDDKLQWMAEFMQAARARGLEIFAITHHEYIEVDSTSFFSPQKLNVTNDIAIAVNKTCRENYPSAGIWAGEIGPHNGGSPPCDHSSMRWANFANSAWYLDALGTKARAGYQAFCRQDFIGADYGLVDCSTADPLPDYYAAKLFQALMGPGVLRAAVTTLHAGAVRAYAHCSRKTPGGLTALLLNLASTPVNITLTLSGGNVGSASWEAGSSDPMVEYHLTATGDVMGTGVSLNDVPLVMTAGALPALNGISSAAKVVRMTNRSYAFVELPNAGAPACQ